MHVQKKYSSFVGFHNQIVPKPRHWIILESDGRLTDTAYIYPVVIGD